MFNDKLCKILLWSEKKNIVAITFVYPIWKQSDCPSGFFQHSCLFSSDEEVFCSGLIFSKFCSPHGYELPPQPVGDLQLGLARFIDASIYRDTFPAICIAILFFTITIVLFFLIIFFFPQLFSFRQKRYIIISTCDFCKVIPQIHSYFVKIFCEISVETN